MSIARNFDDFKEEIELAFIQNACVEIELYSLIASVIRESKNKQKLSVRDVSSRKRSEISAKYYGLSGFPDFVLLERKKVQDAPIYGCIEAKMPTIALNDKDEQLRGHIESFKKVIYTNGLNWKFFNRNEKCFDIELGSIIEGKIEWNEESNWKEIIYVFLTIFLYLLKCPQSLILSALRAFCFCGKAHIPRSIFLYFRYQSWLKSW